MQRSPQTTKQKQHQPLQRTRCVRCVMASGDDPAIRFDTDGVCSHCRRYDELLATRVADPRTREQTLQRLVGRIRRDGRGLDYDCVAGVSGGVDSTYVAWMSRQLGLRPLVVHLDNGWNSTLAVSNIEQVVKRLNLDLATRVLNWDEFRDLQVAFLRASVPDGEIPTDHAISALLWQKAKQHGIRYILSGMNFATESISVPAWAYGHSDWTYIQDVHQRFGRRPLRDYPHFSLTSLLWTNAVSRVRIVSLLNYIDYQRDVAVRTLQKELGWIPYSGKHHESVYTRWFQGRLLPMKFGIDKRVGHCSDLINAGQMTRDEALTLLNEPPYAHEDQIRDDEYVRVKLELSEDEFSSIWAAPKRTFRDFKTQYAAVQGLRRSVNLMRLAGLYPR
jgi:N-acetyl sugar amidotransferase